jgi:serine O-acetyltransferase
MTSIREQLRAALDLFRADAARWVVPEQRAPLDEVTPKVIVRLLYHHSPLRAMAWCRFGAMLRAAGVRGSSEWTRRRLLRVYGLDISPNQPIGGGLYIAHTVGCVLHAERIGSNVSVIAGVTFGTRTDARWPVIGDGAFFGAGARVLGGITVGEDAQVGANAVVLHDVDPGATVVGVPARPVVRR